MLFITLATIIYQVASSYVLFDDTLLPGPSPAPESDVSIEVDLIDEPYADYFEQIILFQNGGFYKQVEYKINMLTNQVIVLTRDMEFIYMRSCVCMGLILFFSVTLWCTILCVNKKQRTNQPIRTVVVDAQPISNNELILQKN